MVATKVGYLVDSSVVLMAVKMALKLVETMVVMMDVVKVEPMVV